MARISPTKPRKSALQARSRATVDALVEATARILVRDGFEKASTNRIADMAGVSVGSLYQYFPSKEALVAAVIDRHNEEIMAIVRTALTEVADYTASSPNRSRVPASSKTSKPPTARSTRSCAPISKPGGRSCARSTSMSQPSSALARSRPSRTTRC